MMWALKRRVLALGVALALVSACSTSSQPAHTTLPTGGTGTFTWALTGDWDTFNVQGVLNTYGSQIAQALYDRLITVGPGGKLVPYLAQSWSVTPTSVTFTMKKGATCADGTAVTPEVVAGSFKSLFAANSAFVPLSFGAGPFTVTSDDQAGTVTVTDRQPFSDLIYAFTSPYSAIVCPSGLATPSSLGTKPAGSGPFTLVSAVHGDNVTLKLRPEWSWGPNGTTAKTPGMPETLVFKIVPNPTTTANLLTTGALDLATITGADVTRLKADKTLINKVGRSFSGTNIIFNHAPSHSTSDPAVRKALSMVVDRKQWNQVANFGYGAVTTSYLTKDADCFSTESANLIAKPDLAKARSVLESAGYKAGSDGKLSKDSKPLTVRVIGQPAFNSGPEYLQSQFASLGATVTLSANDFIAYQTDLRGGNFDVTVIQGGSAIPAPSNNFSIFLGPFPPVGLNFGHISSPEQDSEYKTAMSSLGNERCQHWRNIQDLFLKNNDIMPLAAVDWNWFGRKVDFLPSVTYLDPTTLRLTG